MNFSFAEEQNLLRDSVQKFVQDEYEFEKRRQLVHSQENFSNAHWRTFAELGWLSLPFDESLGGFGGTIIDSIILMEEFGKGLVVEPFLVNVGLAGPLLSRLGPVEKVGDYIQKLIAGELQLALAVHEPHIGSDFAKTCTSATLNGDHYLLSGEKTYVLNGADADYLLVVARTSGQTGDRSGIDVFLVDANSPGLNKTTFKTIDGHYGVRLQLDQVAVDAGHRLGESGQALSALEFVINEAIVLLCAEAVGAMESLYTKTVEYCKTRKQFGLPIGKFQVLQHRMADMFMDYEQSKSMLFMAAIKWRDQTSDAARCVSALKAQIGKAGRLVGQQAVQLHGGIGMTDELDIGHYFKRVTAIDALFGNRDYHLQRMSQLAE